tara:strand:- start:10809 stop:12695 length:1887 start_codon:yes stop_codon:yes gene_type:complete
MSWWKDLIDGAVDFTTTGTTGSTGIDTLLQGAIGYGVNKSGASSANVPMVGYQGGIPEYEAVRERVPTDPNRRAGGQNQRYFTDMQYATSPEDKKAPTMEEAQGIAAAQRNMLAQQNDPNASPPPPPTAENAPVGGIPPISPPAEDAGGGSYVDLGPLGGSVFVSNDGSISSGPNQPPTTPPPVGMAPPPQAMAMGGIASVKNGYYLGGKTDGMADEIPATIDGTQEARLSDGEFVIPADVVSHLGNGNSDAGANQLHGMMDNVRKERTGNSEQGKQIDPNKFMPTMAQGGIANAYNYGGPVRKFNVGGGTSTPITNVGTDPTVGKQTGQESSLSSWAGPYVTDMLGRGAALGDQGFQGFGGPLTAETSNLQNKSFEGIGALKTPTTMGAFTPKTFDAEQATAGMNPYLMASLNPQLDEARRQSEISRVGNAGRMTKAGAFGGSRQALMDMENQRNLETNLANITGKGYASAYDRAQQQFNTQQNREMAAQNTANQYGFDVLGGYGAAGATQRGIEQQGLSADKAQFEEERDFPYKQVQYMQSLLQGLPLEAQSYSYSQPSDMQNLLGSTAGIKDIMESLYGSSGPTPPTASQILTGATMGLDYDQTAAGTVTPAETQAELDSIPDDY